MLLVTMLVKDFFKNLTSVIVYVHECKVKCKRLAPKYPKAVARITINFGLVQIHDEQLQKN